MSADDVDPIDGVVGYLSGVQAVIDLADEFDLAVGAFVYGGELHPDAADSMPRPAVVISPAGGIGDQGDMPLDRQRIDARNYGRTPREANRVAKVIHDALRALRRQVIGPVFLHAATPSGGFIGLREPSVRWPLTLRTYLVLYDEREVV